ncbi:MAG: hypothetical protein J7L34_03750, partial [Thermotogaceae bacterium]|nr:hypothetical protein [Thermotogaceae bacterium]
MNFDKEDNFSVEVSPLAALTNINYQVPHGWWKVADASTPLYLYEELPHFLTIKLSFQNSFSKLHVELPLRKSLTAFFTWPDTTMNFLPEYPYISMDMNFPRNSYLYFNFKDNFLMIGRTKLKWGYWDYPVSISDYAPYFDNITYIFKSGNWFSYTYHLIWLDPILTQEEYKIQSEVTPVNSDPLSPYYDRSKVMVAHRLDFLVFPNFRFSIGEMNMIGGKNPDLFTISPVNVWHNNYTESFTNSIGILQLSWTPVNGLNFYFDFALDDYAVPLTEPSDVKPTAHGLSAGIIKTFSTKFANFMLTLNYSETTKWMYNTFLPYLKYDARIRFISNFPVSARTMVSFPIGFKYGSDSSLISFDVRFFNKYMNGDLKFLKLEKGKTTILTAYKSDVPDDTVAYCGLSFSL